MEEFITYEQVKDVSLEQFFKGSTAAMSAFKHKYFVQDFNETTPAQVFKRVADYAALSEETEEAKAYWANRWFHEFWTGQWMAAGSILQGAANPRKVSLSNCTTIGFGGDTLEDIFDCAYQVAKVAAYRQGLGVFFNLRPKGMRVNNSSNVSQGNTHWMKYINEIGNFVGQAGRIPAMLFSISDSNPDLLDFITIKSDQQTISNANISVQLTDKFMKCLEKDGIWKMSYRSESGELLETEERATVIFDAFVQNNWRWAEPGAQFIDVARKYSNSDYLGENTWKILGTNACIPDTALLLTQQGIKQLKDVGVGHKIWTGQRWSPIKRKWITGVKPVYHYTTSSSEFIGTEDHKIFQNGERVPVGEAECIDWCRGPSAPLQTLTPQDIMDGLVLGDGGIHKASNNLRLLFVGQKDQDYFSSEISGLIGRKRDAMGETAYEVTTTLAPEDLVKTYLRRIPERFMFGTLKQKCGFLRGLFTANGSLAGNRVTLKQTSYDLINQVRLMLSSMGIRSYVTENKSKDIVWKNGTYASKKSYDLNITTDRKLFSELVGFIQGYKTQRLAEIVEKTAPKEPRFLTSEISRTEFIAEMEVWDLEVEAEEHSFWCNGSLVSNCSEQYLEFEKGKSSGLCVLSSANFMYLFRKFGKDLKAAKTFLTEQLGPSMNRFLDNVVTREIEDKRYPIPEQLNSLKSLRRTGAGITNIDGYLIYNGIGYDTDEGIETIYQLMDSFNLGLYQSSIKLGAERGNYEAFNYDLVTQSPFIKQMKKRHGVDPVTMRNVCVGSIAPTGSLSLLFPDLVSYGIEPIMGLYYWKRSRTSGKWEWSFWVLPFVREILAEKGVDIGMDSNSIPDDENGSKGERIAAIIDEHFPKDKFKPAHLIDPFKKVDLMSRLTKECVDSSISVTYNLPEDVSLDTIRDIYIYAWKKEVKSISIYRDKSRVGVVEFESPRIVAKRYVKEDEQAVQAVQSSVLANAKRPEKLSADVFHLTVKGEKWVAFLGKSEEDRPFEIFAGKQEELYLPAKYKTGVTIKEKRDYYFESGEGEDKIRVNISRSFKNDEHSALTRQVSLGLRHGVPLIYIIDQLDKSHGTIVEFSKVLMRVLKNYLLDEEVTGKIKCTSCGSRNLTFQEKCFVCLDCGGGKC